MKVLHITTYAEGGAGIAALRLHEALLKSTAVESRVLVLHNSDNAKKEAVYLMDVSSSRTGAFENKVRNFLFSKFGIATTPNHKKQKAISGKGQKFENFTSPVTDYKVENHALLSWCDVVHLHWVANFVNYKSFFAAVTKPIVWTLHDAGALMGGFHLAYDAEVNKSNFSSLENEYHTIKYNAVKQVNKLAVIAPSQWLVNVSMSSNMFGQRKHQHIFNALPTHRFNQLPRENCRQLLQLEEGFTYLLFIGHSIGSYNKGADIMHQLIKSNTLSKTIRFITVGDGAIDDKRVVNFGHILNEQILNIMYGACDAVVIPSRSENMPNVMTEAMSAGRPFVSFHIGGLAETVLQGVNGLTGNVTDCNAENLEKLIHEFEITKHSFDESRIRSFAVGKFSYPIIAKQHQEYYAEIA